MSAAAISPMLIAFLRAPAYEAAGFALASDVLAGLIPPIPMKKTAISTSATA